MKKQQSGFGKRALSCVTAVALASTMVALPATAFAADETHQAKNVDGLVTASVTPASQSATEILGISNVDELQLDPADVDININNEKARQNYLKYILMGTDEWNKNPNPLYFNTVYKIPGSAQVVNNKDKRRSTGEAVDSSFMPNRALAPYGTKDDSDNKVWNMLPDIIVGIGTEGNDVDYASEPYARAVEKQKGLAANSYNPKGVSYLRSNAATLADIVSNLYDIAKVGDEVAKASNGKKQLRYGDAIAIAKNFEKYVKGIQGYILKRLDSEKASKKTVAVITATTPELVTLQQTPSAWNSTGNRFLEITTLVAKNYADGLKTNDESKATAQLSMADLKAAVSSGKIDLIIVNDGAKNGISDLSGLESKTYWANNSTSSDSVGAIYKVNANAPEIATNYGRILGCLYPEYVDQSDLVAYYYDKFYHIKDAKLKEAIDRCMDGVRNWDVQSGSGNSYLQWNANTVANYNAANVQNLLNEGAAYAKELAAKNAKGFELIAPTANLAAADLAFTSTVKPNDLTGAVVALSASTAYYTGKAITPAVTVKAGAKTLVNGTDYTVAYKNNTNIGTATVTVTGKGAYAGTVSKNFTITVKKSAKYSVGSYKYQITNAATNGKGTVTVYGAVKSASKLTGAVKIPATVKIGGKSFKVTAVANNAFKGYKKITSLTVGNNVTTIGTSAFQGCVKLKTATLGSAVTTIGTKAFYGDKVLKTVKITSKKLKKVGKNAIKGIAKTAKVKVPSAKVKAYKKLFKSSTGFAKTMRLSK